MSVAHRRTQTHQLLHLERNHLTRRGLSCAPRWPSLRPGSAASRDRASPQACPPPSGRRAPCPRREPRRALHLGRREVGESGEGDSSGGAGDLTNDDKGGETEGSFTGGATDGRLVAGGGGLDGLSTLLNACCALEVSTFSRSSVTLFGCSGGGSTGHSISHCVAPLFWLKRLAKKTPTGFGGSTLVSIRNSTGARVPDENGHQKFPNDSFSQSRPKSRARARRARMREIVYGFSYNLPRTPQGMSDAPGKRVEQRVDDSECMSGRAEHVLETV